MSYVEINRLAAKRKVLNNFLTSRAMRNHSSTLVIGTFQVVFFIKPDLDFDRVVMPTGDIEILH